MFSEAILSAVLATLIGQAAAAPTSNLFVRADPPLTNASIPVKALGSLSLPNAGFASIISQEGKNSLFVSAFAAFGSDAGYRISDINNALSGGMSKVTATKIGGSVTWPNDIVEAPKSVFGSDGVVVGGGFLVPGKGNGGLWFSPSSGGKSGDWIKLAGKSGWFYHRAAFADIDGDGQTEIVSCRAKKGAVGGASTMLVTLKPADASQPTGAWTETEIGAGCDALFTVADINGDGIPDVLAASYFTKEFNLFYSTAKTGFKNVADVKKVLIDKSIGAAFDVKHVDVNGDGKKDLLVTNHQGGSDNPSGSVYAYEIPADVTNVSGYVKHTLASGFPVTQGGLNQASPGSPVAFYPTTASKGPVYIALAGDAAQIAYVLIPSGDWKYTTTTLHNCKCTVGSLAVGDIDGDGTTEIFVPCYDNGQVVGFSFGK